MHCLIPCCSLRKLESVKKALDLCDGSLREAKDLYGVLNEIAKNLDGAVKEKLLHKTKYTKSIDQLTSEEQELGGALFKALKKLEDSKKVDLSDVWPKYHYLIKVFTHEHKFEKEKEVAMELKEKQIPLCPIKHILDVLETQKVDARKLKEAKKQYDMVMSHGLNSYPEFQALKERYKKTLVEPKHITTTHHKIAPDLSEVLGLAWGCQVDFSQEAIKELFLMLETFNRVKEKSHSMPASGVARSGDINSTSSSSKSLCLSTENIDRVFKQCSKKYQSKLIENAEKELEQLKTYVRKFSSREEMVFLSHGQKNEWYEQCLQARTDILESMPFSGRPLFILLQTAIDDKTRFSNRATSEYCSLLHLEMLFNGMENKKSESRPRMDSIAPIVHVPSVQMSVNDIIHSMEKYIPHEFYKEALGEFRKLQEIEEKIAQDENLRSRKVAWKERSRGGSRTYVDDKTPSRPLHAVLLRAQKEGIEGSESALIEYGSMLHSEVLYESKDNFTQISAEPLEVNYETKNSQTQHKSLISVERESSTVPSSKERISKEEEQRQYRDKKVEAKSGSDVKGMLGRAGSHYSKEQDFGRRRRDSDESKEFALQQEIDKLKDQLRIKNSEIEDLTTRLSQAASRSLMHNNPNIADLSDKNRPTKIGERFEQLFDNEWSDAHEKLKSTISEREIYIILIEVVKDVYKFCKNALQQQILNIKEKLETQIRDPRFVEDKKAYVGAGKGDKMLSWMCEKSASEFQKGNAIHSVLGLTMIYKDYCKHRNFLQKELRYSKLEKIYPFIDATVELCWLMCAQTPPMQLVFAERNSTVNKSNFRCTGHTGDRVDVCAWPAVILHDGGPVVTRGHVLPL